MAGELGGPGQTPDQPSDKRRQLSGRAANRSAGAGGAPIELAPLPPIPGRPAATALRDALRELVRSSRYRNLEQLGKQLGSPRSKQRLSEWLVGHRLPAEHELEQLRQACPGPRGEGLAGLLAAARAEASAAAAVPAPGLAAQAVVAADAGRLPLVGEYTRWFRLGVHRPITLLADGQDLSARVDAGELPGYVLREPDRALLRPALAEAAAGRGPTVRLIVMTGESAAGKTRTAVEAMRAELGGWRLLIPRSAEQLASLLDQGFDLRHVVVWLNEIQELLVQPRGVKQLDRLLDLPVGPTVLLATLRTDAEDALQNTPAWGRLDQAHLRITLHRRPPTREWQAELARARHLAEDPWIVEALKRVGDRYGIAEWLAAGPQLIRHHDRARASSNPVHRMAAAVVAAAIDCYRAGYTRPIPEPLLRDAYRYYLTDNTGTSDSAWPAVLEWARHPIAGAVGLLIPFASRGDKAFDYLISAAAHDTPPVNERLWPILARHATPATLATIAAGAHRHAPNTVAEQQLDRRWQAYLTRRADTGEPHAAQRLAELLAFRGDEAELARRADSGDQSAAEQLAALLANRGDKAGLARRADTGDKLAAQRLAMLLAKPDDYADLVRCADLGAPYYASRLAGLLVALGDEAELARRADTGDPYAAARLASLLADLGDEAELARRADTGDPYAAARLADLLFD
jgi:hypothetical protein